MKEETGAICWDGALLHKALHRHFQIGPSHELRWRAHSAGCWMSPRQGLSVKPTLVYFVPAFPQSMCSAAAKCPSWCALKKFRLQTPLLPISFSSADCFPWSCWSWLWNLKGLSGERVKPQIHTAHCASRRPVLIASAVCTPKLAARVK